MPLCRSRYTSHLHDLHVFLRRTDFIGTAITKNGKDDIDELVHNRAARGKLGFGLTFLFVVCGDHRIAIYVRLSRKMGDVTLDDKMQNSAHVFGAALGELIILADVFSGLMH